MWLPHKVQFGCNPATFSLKLFQGPDGTFIGIHDALPEGHNDDKLQCDLMTLTVITICISLSHYILHHPVSQNESVPTSLSMSFHTWDDDLFLSRYRHWGSKLSQAILDHAKAGVTLVSHWFHWDHPKGASLIHGCAGAARLLICPWCEGGSCTGFHSWIVWGEHHKNMTWNRVSWDVLLPVFLFPR